MPTDIDPFFHIVARVYRSTDTKTQQELANTLNIQQSLISQAFAAKKLPVYFLSTLFIAYNLNPLWLLTGKGEKKIPYLSRKAFKKYLEETNSAFVTNPGNLEIGEMQKKKSRKNGESKEENKEILKNSNQKISKQEKIREIEKYSHLDYAFGNLPSPPLLPEIIIKIKKNFSSEGLQKFKDNIHLNTEYYKLPVHSYKMTAYTYDNQPFFPTENYVIIHNDYRKDRMKIFSFGNKKSIMTDNCFINQSSLIGIDIDINVLPSFNNQNIKEEEIITIIKPEKKESSIKDTIYVFLMPEKELALARLNYSYSPIKKGVFYADLHFLNSHLSSVRFSVNELQKYIFGKVFWIYN